MKRILLSILLALTAFGYGYSQNTLKDTVSVYSLTDSPMVVQIDLVQMDSIYANLTLCDNVKKQFNLLELNVADLRLALTSKDSTISAYKSVVANKDYTIQNYKEAVMEMEVLVGESEAICKVEKKRIRNRWVIVTLSLVGTAFAVGVIAF